VGAWEVAGAGSGSGGEGIGTGSGNQGAGSGGGGGMPPRRIKGNIRNSDYPRTALLAGAEGRVSVRFTVGIDGRATNCSVIQSSGNADLDATSCGVIETRFRYRPARDPQGRPVPSIIMGDHFWEIRGRRMPPPEGGMNR
jgi:protein TonB